MHPVKDVLGVVYLDGMEMYKLHGSAPYVESWGGSDKIGGCENFGSIGKKCQNVQ